MSWIFFVTGPQPNVVNNALAIRIAETEQLIAVGPAVSFLRSSDQLRFHKRASRLPNTHLEAYYQPIHFPVRLPLARAVCDRLNRSLFRKEIRRLLPDGPRVVCYGAPQQHRLVGLLKEDLSVYYVVDDFTVTLQGTPIQGELEAERRLLEQIDLIVCVNGPLSERLRANCLAGQTPIYVLPNFYDERVFNPEIVQPEPELLRRVPRPRLLVAGHISDRIDWNGIVAASKLKPDWSWVFLGRVVEPHMEARVAQLAGKGFLLPGVPFEEVPAWIQHSDACAVPYHLNRFTLASDPLKVPEYLAMGAPVLSTRVPALSRFGEAIYWVEEGDGESYAKALDAAANQSSNKARALRRRAAEPDSLAARADQFRMIVLEHLDVAPTYVAM